MKPLALIASLLVAPLVLADIGFRQGTTYIGPVRDIDCAHDGGLYCTRDAGIAIGRLRCVTASATEPGCITPSDQTLAGTKTLTGDLRLVGHVHASLTACSSGVKGMWQTCTGHNAPVFCDGTNNIELLGTSAPEEVLWPIYVNGVPVPFMGAITLSSSSSWTITSVMGWWGVGTGSGSFPITFVSSAGTCTCSIDCDVPGARTACTGNCTAPASGNVFAFGALSGTSTCTRDPYVGGNLLVMGTQP